MGWVVPSMLGGSTPSSHFSPKLGLVVIFLSLWSVTSQYYHYAITLHIAKPGPAYTWHSEPEHVTWNHNLEPTKSVRWLVF